MSKKPENDTETKAKPVVATSLQDLSTLLDHINEDESEESDQSEEKRKAYTEFRNSTYNIVSLMAYLIGVDKIRFGESDTPYLIDVYAQAAKDKNARIISNLSRLRTAFEKNYMRIANEFNTVLKNIGSIPELIPSDAFTDLCKDGVTIYNNRPQVDDYLIKINTEINNRINGIKPLFPEWINWEYIRPIFIMPEGTKKSGLKKAGALYNSDRNRYPFHCWINWEAVSYSDAAHGNILYCDEKFIVMLYERNNDRFENLSLVRDVGDKTMRNLSDLLEHCSNCVMVVDCENSDAVKLAAAIGSLSATKIERIRKIILFDSEYTTDQWKTFVDKSLRMAIQGKNSIDIEHIVVQRLNQNKSQVDMTLAMRTSREIFVGGADAIILVSSDSDYWAMIRELEGIRFLVMLEKSKSGNAIIDRLAQCEIPFCFIDDFCTSASYSIKTTTLLNKIQEQIDSILKGDEAKPLNLRKIMGDALKDSWIAMTEKEKEAFYNRYLSKPKLVIGVDGQASITLA